MSDDPSYPSPIVKSQKKYKTRAQTSNLCSTGYNQGWAQEISKTISLLLLLLLLLWFLFPPLLLLLHVAQLEHNDQSVPLPVFRTDGQIAKVCLAPYMIKNINTEKTSQFGDTRSGAEEKFSLPEYAERDGIV